MGPVLGVNPGNDDSTAVLQGIGSWGLEPNRNWNQCFLAPPTIGFDQEVEIRLNTTISAHSITGYECNYSTHTDGTQYSSIVRWNGPFENFTRIAGPCGNLGLPQY